MRKTLRMLTALLTVFALLGGTGMPAVRAEEEYTLPREEGTRQLTFYWYRPDTDYDTCDMWIWYPNKDGKGYLFHPCEYGVKVVLNVPEDVEKVGFIVRRDCSEPGGSSWGSATKDYDGDRYAELSGDVTEVYLKPADPNLYRSDDHGKTLYQKKEMILAAISDMNTIDYTLNPATIISSPDQVKVTDAETGEQLEVAELSRLNTEAAAGTITLAAELDLSRVYTVEVEGYNAVTAMPTKVFDTPAFVERYVYDGDDLGAVITENGTRFKVWAPTACMVQLALFEAGDGCDAFTTMEMTRGEKGVWTAEASCGAGTYYTYLVTTAAGTQEAVDPYARAVGVNGNRGMVVDLDATDPEGFAEDTYYDGISAYNQAVIWEVHVRDFSNKLASSGYPGKYLAFTERGLTNASGEPAGVDYLVDLGITHVHLQPVYDYATVDEASDEPQFNWGYDPKNYNAPEGSYSTDPFHGEVRVKEFKQMVQALHRAGIGVIMDVVYNHTWDGNSNLNKVVPYYYYRYNNDGSWSNGSGCGNETASERAMYRKYMVDSVCYWAEEYHVDGFRFDLMALHDVETMQAVEAAVHAVNPKAMIYGEGWTGGSTPLSSQLQANQANISQVKASAGAIGAVAVFDDAIRDGLKGSVFNSAQRGYISGAGSKENAKRVIHGLNGGIWTSTISWSGTEGGVICYMACHDNHTIYDKLLASNGPDSEEARLQMNRFGISIIMIGKGTPFFLAGEEMLRSKGGDSNSYKSSDEVNNLRWDDLTAGSEQMAMRDFYRSLITLRKANPFITGSDVSCEVLDLNNAIAVRYMQRGQVAGYALANPGPAAEFELPAGEWQVLMLNGKADPEGTETLSGTVQMEERTVLLVRAK